MDVAWPNMNWHASTNYWASWTAEMARNIKLTIIHPHWFLNKTFTPMSNHNAPRLLESWPSRIIHMNASLPGWEEKGQMWRLRCIWPQQEFPQIFFLMRLCEWNGTKIRPPAPTTPTDSSLSIEQIFPYSLFVRCLRPSTSHDEIHAPYAYNPIRVTATRRQYLNRITPSRRTRANPKQFGLKYLHCNPRHKRDLNNKFAIRYKLS